jgi:hypothetical protein
MMAALSNVAVLCRAKQQYEYDTKKRHASAEKCPSEEDIFCHGHRAVPLVTSPHDKAGRTLRRYVAER